MKRYAEQLTVNLKPSFLQKSAKQNRFEFINIIKKKLSIFDSSLIESVFFFLTAIEHALYTVMLAVSFTKLLGIQHVRLTPASILDLSKNKH